MNTYHNEWYHKNKHRLRDGRRELNRDQYRLRKELIIAEKIRRGSCEICLLECTIENHVCFDFDHIDQGTKEFNIGDSRSGKAIVAIQKEMAKCRLVCRNCHAIHTYTEQHWKFRRTEDGTMHEANQHPDQQQLDL
jgi:hypothetical protein